MRVISKSRLRVFWNRANHGDSEEPLKAWYTHINNKSVAWKNWSDVKKSFGNADLVGNCAVFNIGGNKYRLIARILFQSQKVFVLKVMTHKEYDKDNWKDECGCYSDPPTDSQKKIASSKAEKKRK